MFNLFNKSDQSLQNDVKTELSWDPSVTNEQISVTAVDGVVTLRGTVPHYFEKCNAENAAQRVGGVRAVANEVEVKLLSDYERSDQDIARAALNALEWNYSAPKGIKVSVENGWVTLKGEVEWDFQRNAGREAVSPLMGVRGVTNEITIKTKVLPSDVQTRIEDALKRTAEREGRKINVAIIGDKVKLTGNVHSYAEMDDATNAAWNAPGVMKVQNDLKIAA